MSAIGVRHQRESYLRIAHKLTPGTHHVVSPAAPCPALPAQALADVAEKIAALAPSGLVLVVDSEDKELVAQNADEPFVPASVTKIVTAWLALQVLGADYRFETRFYLDAKRVLYVHGGDASYYPAGLRIPGVEDSSRSFDALNSALAVNFNTINAVPRQQG
jgi:D-alanyl-D-alanine carboxypeptidase/D-alanyl-D-alanine-endopeptidase (penicillin-binding protein 4)